jgi:uncharacterized protein (TIGR02145 family)
MKIQIYFLCLILFYQNPLMSQKPFLSLTFHGKLDTLAVKVDKIEIRNKTKQTDTTLYWPDTVLMLEYYNAINEANQGKYHFCLMQAYPNPSDDRIIFKVCVPETDLVYISISDVMGKTIVYVSQILEKGTHSFVCSPETSGIYIITAQWKSEKSSIKTMYTSRSEGINTLQHIDHANFINNSNKAGLTGFSFSPGDQLLFLGFSNGIKSGIASKPMNTHEYTFQFAVNIPCPEIPSIIYEGQYYNTIQILSQCWLRENLNVGSKVQGSYNQNDNGEIEKYCFSNDETYCQTRGGLYQWNEMMKYMNQPGGQGICPPGWHLPSYEDWKILEGAVDSQFGIGDPEWDKFNNVLGYDAGYNLKTLNGWYEYGGGANLFGFWAWPAGQRDLSGSFNNLTAVVNYWTSDEINEDNSKFISLRYNENKITAMGGLKIEGKSVRCLKDE